MARTEIARVVSIDSVGDGVKAALASERFHAHEQLILTVVATIGIVGDVQWIVELLRGYKLMPQAGGTHARFGLFAIVARKAGRKSGDGERTGAQRLIGRPGEISGVCAARKCDEKRTTPAERGEQAFLLFKRQKRGGFVELLRLLHLLCSGGGRTHKHAS